MSQPFSRADRRRIAASRPNAVRCWNGQPITRHLIILDALCHAAGVKPWYDESKAVARRSR